MNELKKNNRHIKSCMKQYIKTDDPELLMGLLRLISKRNKLKAELKENT